MASVLKIYTHLPFLLEKRSQIHTWFKLSEMNRVTSQINLSQDVKDGCAKSWHLEEKKEEEKKGLPPVKFQIKKILRENVKEDKIGKQGS